jgi:ribonuclease VapC
VSGAVVDTSAVVAILGQEPLADALLAALDAIEDRLLSAATLVELGIVVAARYGPTGAGIVDRFVRDGGLEVVAFDRQQADRALEGWQRYGKGRHPAALNLGDCVTYGLAVASDLPVLCVGDDFTQTDVTVVPLDSPAPDQR